MLPSLLAKDIQDGLRQFLTTGFEASDDFMSGIMARFVKDPAGWLKGPYLQLGLPFTTGAAGKQFFKGFETQFPGFSHQEGAWQRLSSQHLAQSTLVATGTGSGKTECFVYPVLDHCARALAAKEAGVKALVIYPMNALASDQARRFAELVATVPAFKGLRVGLYVGGNAVGTGQGTVMTSTAVITDRDTLRKNPPDILLTNYKMLDYLMLRPKDRTLWDRNQPETLRYVVVDELHTFDGAQGTDLALLLRRLRARLKSPEGHLICAGTSATLGGFSDTWPLRDYARQVFGVAFEPESVITESRQSVGVFLEDATVDYVFSALDNPKDVLDATRFTSPEEAVKAWYSVFFPDLPPPADVSDMAWRLALGEQLKKHQIFVNMLKLVKGQVVHYEDLKQQLKNGLPLAMQPWVGEILDALLVLVSWARVPGGAVGRPLLNLRVQMWMRELRRMVANLAVNPQDVKLRSSADVPSNPDGVYLPLIQCTACRTTGWLSRLVQSSSKLSTKLDEIYNTWFASRPEVTRFYAANSFKRPQVEGVMQQVCTGCGNLQSHGAKACVACSEENLLSIFRVTEMKSGTKGEVQYTRHDNTCPACGERDRMLLVGARNATLGAQVVEHSWASPFNDDKKLIAFSDSVQDAAHRAGFFGARTYQNNVRMALSKVMDEVIAGSSATALPWSEFLTQMAQSFDKPGAILYMAPEKLVAEFIGPNMTWHPHWSVELLQNGALPTSSRLPDLVRRRLLWQAVSEMTYLSHRGRTLERIGKACLTVPMARLAPLVASLLPVFEEKYGLKGLQTTTLAQWLWGALAHMRKRGAVLHDGMDKYAEEGNVYGLSQIPGRKDWMPSMSPYTPHPVFVTLGRHKEFDKLKGDKKANWFDRWSDAVFVSRGHLLAPGLGADLLSEAVDLLVREDILKATDSHLGVSLAINPAALVLDTDVKWLTTPQGKRLLTVPSADADALLGSPCLDSTDEHYELATDAGGWLARRYSQGDLGRVIAAEHTGLLERQEREALEIRFKSKEPKPWYENLLSATPTLEMGVDIGDLSSVLLCSVPPNQASYLQRLGRAGRRDGNAMTTTLADGASPHDLYFFEETQEMMSGEVAPPGVFLQAAEVLRRQLFAYCMDDWVSGIQSITALPEKTSVALDAVEAVNLEKFPYNLTTHVLTHEQRLMDGFLALLGTDITKNVSDRLRDYMQGQGDKDGMRTRLLKSLEDLVGERKSYRKRKDQVDTLIRAVKQKPQDDATREELDNLDRERGKLIELVSEINKRDLLATLTDVGLIPNYAFPEAGIELKSVLWRKKSDGEQGQGNYVALPALKYERPANSALSEFAPENRFYANQRRVEVDQINMSLAKTESWRFCPSCQHMQNLELSQDTEVVCPHCGDAMWGDAAQKRTLLRFKQAIANSDDTKVRIDDSADDREPKIYVRQLLADFEPKDIQVAWQIENGGLPFGFEFVSKVTFRDVNFGELSKPGDSFKVADKDSGRPGFKLCKHCGKVQKPPKRQTDPVGQIHSFDCPRHGSEEPDNLLECLYLYREFESEALRILVPYTRSGVDEEVVQSFMAALQLGLKKRFGGKVDHLRMVVQDEPGKEGGPRRHFVMLYDSVPGGTGYLHQLLAQDAGTLTDVLGMALEAVKTCSCNDDPDKDGCYRCLYQYRLGRNMQQVSRDRAAEVLTELVGSLHQLVQVPSIGEIYINPNFDSVLEARFIESLKRMGGVGGLPKVKLVQDIVNGKSGFVIEVGTQRYKIEPQVNEGPSTGVAVASKPDFVIWPWQSGTLRKPVAVFCDGWQYHQNSLREDANKRSALVLSGKYWVWSVTHDDVKAALDGNAQTDLDSPMATLRRHDGNNAPVAVLRPVGGAFTSHSVAQLLSFLATPPGTGTQDDGMAMVQRNVLWLNFLMLPNTPDEKTFVEGKMKGLLAQLPLDMQAPKPAHAPVLSKGDATPKVMGWWPVAYAKGKTDDLTAPGVVLLDDVDFKDADTLHLNWRKWLALYNQQQMLPGMLLATRTAMDAGDCAGWTAAPQGGAGLGAASADQQMLAKDWADAIDQTLEPLRPGLRELAALHALLPLIGHELANERNQVVAEAEMAWPDKRLVLLTAEQEDMADAWTGAGWMVLQLSENDLMLTGMPWPEAVVLNLNNPMSAGGAQS
jgi:DEAD/DEAH box helicase domain-containing protein